MITPAAFCYYDLRGGIKSRDISLLFPGWGQGEGELSSHEHLAIISPHDDDGVLGAGYLILAALANGARVTLVVVCNGCFGYSHPADKPTIVARRKAETLAAYRLLGLSEDDIIFLDYPDFSAWPNLGWYLPGGQTGAMARFLPAMRLKAPTRLILPNAYREHQDHEAAYRIGAYDGPQIGDAVAVDHGKAEPVRSYLQYSVWADFDPEDALVTGASAKLRANLAIQVDEEVETVIASSIYKFVSQLQVIEALLSQRSARRLRNGRAIELYLALDPRPPLDFEPYHQAVDLIDRSVADAGVNDAVDIDPNL
jgi:LmbE family N-acetylglucosaminyl deacetylase